MTQMWECRPNLHQIVRSEFGTKYDVSEARNSSHASRFLIISRLLARRLTDLDVRTGKLRDQRILLDSDLAELYDVETRVLVQAVKRNLNRFPADFMFKLENQELTALRSQSVISNEGRGGRRTAPYAFTEQGVAMLSSVLNSPRAIAVNIEVMRAFVRMREVFATNKELAAKLDELKQHVDRKLQSHDQAIVGILDAIRQLMNPPEATKRPIGFVTPEEKPTKPKAVKKK